MSGQKIRNPATDMKAAPKGSAPSFNGDKRKAYAHYERLVAKLSKANAAIGGYLAYGTICGPDGVKLGGEEFAAAKKVMELSIYNEVMASIADRATKARFLNEFGADPSAPLGALALHEFKTMGGKRRLSVKEAMVSFRGSLFGRSDRTTSGLSREASTLGDLKEFGKENEKKTDLRASKKMDLRASLRQSGIKAMEALDDAGGLMIDALSKAGDATQYLGAMALPVPQQVGRRTY